MKAMKNYEGLLLDRKGNVLTSILYAAYNIAEARSFFRQLQAESMFNDLHKIKVVKA